MLKKSKKSGSEVSYNDLEKVGGGKIVNIEEHPEVVPNKMPQKLASKWSESKFAIFDDKTNELLDFAKDEAEARDLNKKYNESTSKF